MNFSVCYDAGAVKRFHTIRVAREQTVGDHSWGVIMVLLAICEPSVNLLKAAAYHDVAELATGDMPATAKWADRNLAHSLAAFEGRIEKQWGLLVELTDDELRLLKWADMFELVMYALSEVRMGNQYMNGPLTKGLSYLGTLEPAPSPKASELLLNVFNSVGELK